MSAVVILSVGVAIVLTLPIALRIAQRRFDPFEPIFVFALAWGVMFVVRPIAIVVRDDTNFYGVDIGATLDQAALLGLLGAVSFVAGYEAPLARGLAYRLPGPTPLRPTRRVLSITIAVGLLATLLLVLFLLWADGPAAIRTFLGGRSPEFDEVLRDSPLYLWTLSLAVVPAALVGLVVACLDPRPGPIVAAAALLALALLRVVPTGNRGNLLMLVGGAVVFVYLNRNRRPGVVAVALGLAAALVGSYALLVFRYAENRESVSAALSAVASAPERLVAPLTRGADAEMAPALAGGLQAVPSQLPHRWGGATLGDLAVRPVPRQFWGGKPEPHILVVTEKVWPVARELGGFQPSFTPLLSFYWDLGLLGVVIGMAAYGWLARMTCRYLMRDPMSSTSALLYGLTLWTLVVAVRADPVQLVLHIALMFGPVLLIVWLGASRRGAPLPVAGRT